MNQTDGAQRVPAPTRRVEGLLPAVPVVGLVRLTRRGVAGGSKRRTNFVPLGRRNRVPVRRPWAESPLKKSRRPCLSLRLFGSGLGQRSSPRIRDRQVVQNWSAAYTGNGLRGPAIWAQQSEALRVAP